MRDLDSCFDDFWAETLNFEPNWQQSLFRGEYLNAIQQLRLGIRQGGCGFTSSEMIAAPALYAALCYFTSWATVHNAITELEWLKAHVQGQLHLPYRHAEQNLNTAISQMQTDWGFQQADYAESQAPEEDAAVTSQESEEASSDMPPVADAAVTSQQSEEESTFVLPSVIGLAGDGWPFQKRPTQKAICKVIKRMNRARFANTLQQHDRHRLDGVARHTVPAGDPKSHLVPPGVSETDTLQQTPMGLYSLTCPYELSNHAIDTSLALQLGIPVPHVRFLREHVQDLQSMDPWGDKALNDSVHAANTRKTSHNRIAQELAAIATQAGISTTADEKKIPFSYDEADDSAPVHRRRGDVLTAGGLLRTNASHRWPTRFTRVILDVVLTHTFATATPTAARRCKLTTIALSETSKRSKYNDAYRVKGYAFAPAACNTWGQCGPDLLRFLWALADYAARNALGCPDPASLPLLPAVPGDAQAEERRQSAFKALRGRLFNDYRQRLLCVILEGATERVFGRTQALAAHPCYLQWQDAVRGLWQPVLRNVAPAPSPPLPSQPPAPLAPVSPPCV
jgi:hypothetical protein